MLLRVIQSEADAAGRVDWSVSVDSSIVRAHQHTPNVLLGPCAARKAHRARLNDRNSRCCRGELGDHALGRSRGGQGTKIHAAVDGRGRLLVILLTPGRAARPLSGVDDAGRVFGPAEPGVSRGGCAGGRGSDGVRRKCGGICGAGDGHDGVTQDQAKWPTVMS
jgi:hypothetical protein